MFFRKIQMLKLFAKDPETTQFGIIKLAMPTPDDATVALFKILNPDSVRVK